MNVFQRIYKSTAITILCLFTLDSAIPATLPTPCNNVSTLAPIPGSQNSAVLCEARILSWINSGQLRYAQSDEDQAELNDNRVAIVSKGTILASVELKSKNSTLIREITYKEIHAILQILAQEDHVKYEAIINLVKTDTKFKEITEKYNLLPSTPANADLSQSRPIEDILARSFELAIPKEKNLFSRQDVTEEELNFLHAAEHILNENRTTIFTGIFWLDDVRKRKIRIALANGYDLTQTTLEEDIQTESGEITDERIGAEPRRSSPYEDKHSAEKAIAVVDSAWNRIRSDIESCNPSAGSEGQAFLPRFYRAMERTVSNLKEKVSQGKINPLVDLKTSQEPDSSHPGLVSSSEEIKIGFLAITGNPLNWGHILISFMAMNELDLDTVVYRVQGEIWYKTVLASEPVSVEDRHFMVKEAIRDFFPLLRYTDLGSEPNNAFHGQEETMRLLAMNPDKRIHLYNLVGAESEERMRQAMQWQYESLQKYEYGSNPSHKLTFAVIQRGEYGARATIEDLRKISKAIQLEGSYPFFLDVEFAKDPDIDLNVSSSYYRNTQDGAFVPGSIHEFAKTHGYYGHPPTTPGTGNMPSISIDGASGSEKPTIAEEELSYLASIRSLAQSSLRSLRDNALKLSEEVASSHATGQSLILYADDILSNGLVADIEKTFKNIFPNYDLLKDGKIVLYSRKPEAAKVLSDIISNATPSIEVINITANDVLNQEDEDEIKEVNRIIRLARARGVGQVLTLIKGPTEEPEALVDIAKTNGFPIVVVGPEKGIYSFAQAVSMAMISKAHNTYGWLIMLPPVRTITEDIKRKYEEYQRSLKALIAA